LGAFLRTSPVGIAIFGAIPDGVVAFVFSPVLGVQAAISVKNAITAMVNICLVIVVKLMSRLLVSQKLTVKIKRLILKIIYYFYNVKL
jgi:hypothetical protein